MTNAHSDLRDWVASQQLRPLGAAITLSVVIPAYNESSRLSAPLLDTITYCDAHFDDYEIIVVDDGSTDTTTEVAQIPTEVRPQVRVHTLPQNRGKGAALREGVLLSKGAYVLINDADGATPIQEVARLLEPLERGYDVAIGSRAILDADTRVSARSHRKLIGKTFNLLVNTLLIPEVADTQCGFKLFSRPAAHFLFSRQKCEGFGFDTELLFLAFKVGLKVKEVSVNWHHVPGSKVNLAVDSMKMFFDLLIHRKNHQGVSREDYEQFIRDFE